MHIDDLSVGQNVMIESWNHETAREDVFGSGTAMFTPPARKKTTLLGVPLQIMALNLPFVAVKVLNLGSTWSLDTREVSLIRVNEEYIDALRVNPPANHTDQKI